MKKVVFRSGSLRMGGLERVLIEVLQNIDKNKYKLYLLIEDDSGKDNVFEKDIPKGIEYVFLKDNRIQKIADYLRINKKNIFLKIFYNIFMSVERGVALNSLKKFNKSLGEIDVFVDYDTGASRYIEKIKAKKKIAWIHNSIPNLKRKKSKIERYGKRLDKYDLIVSICDEMKNEIKEIYPHLKDKVHRIYNPFNFSRINNLSEDHEKLNQIERKLMKEKYFLAVSRLDEVQKDYTTLINGFKKAKEKGLKEKLFILGDGPSKEYISNLIDELKLTGEVVLLGQSKNPYVWMKNCITFVHSSKYEGFGMVIVEALSLEKCVISSKCKVGPVEILDSGEYGMLFNVGDSTELSKIILETSSREELRKKYENKAMERALVFDSKVILNEYERIIDE